MKSNQDSYVPYQLRQVARGGLTPFILIAGFLLLAASLTAAAQDFSDNFTRATNSASVLPWLVRTGNWVITNGAFFAGPNANNSYGFAYTTNSLTNCTVTGEFSAPTTAYGYGLGARVNPVTGAHYAAWLYPDNSVGGPNMLKLVKFPDWGTSTFTILQSVNVGAVGSGTHTITMTLVTNLINVYLDGNLQISTTDSSSPFLSGGISVDMYTYASDTYVLKVDNISGSQINFPPTATRDLFTLRGDSTQTVNAPGVLYNDVDPDNANLTAILVSTTSNGTLSFSTNGGFTYARTNNSAFYDSYTYRVTDGTSTSAVATVVLSLTSGGIFYSDNFTRATNPASLLPWTAESGNWAITNGALKGGTNVFPSYGSIYRAANWTNYAVQGSFLFPSNAYGGGVAGRVNPVTGERYVVWLYPELSPRGPNHIRVAKFQTWTTYGMNGAGNAQALLTVALDSVVVSNTWHTLKLGFNDGLLAVHFDGQWLTNLVDLDTFIPPLTNGGLSVDFFSFTNTYMVQADDVSARPLVADDGYFVDEATQLVVGGTGVLSNDTSMTSTGLTAVLVGGPSHGSLVLSTNGSFTYTPSANYYGTDSFTYEARDGSESLGAAVVVITVASANDPPQLANLPSRTIAALSTLSVTNTATDTDVPADILSYALVDALSGMTITTNGVINWTPTLAHSPGSNVITTIVTDNGVPPRSATNSFTVVITNPPGAYNLAVYYEDFDSVTIPGLPFGWTTSATGAQSTWITQNTNRHTLPNAAFSRNPASSGINELVSPAIVLPAGNLQLSFRHNYNLESGFDGGVLEIKIGAGAFTNILAIGGDFVSGGYTHTLATGFSNPLEGRKAWSGNSGGFITTVVALPPAVSGQTIQLRWRCGTDSKTAGGGWWVDSVAIQNNLCCNLFAPVLPTQTNRTVSELVTMSVTNTASDGDLPSDKLTYSLAVSPVGATIATNGVISWMPTELQGPGVSTFTTVVTDKAGLSNTNSFNVTVTEVNVAPAFVLTPTNRTIAELTLLTVTNIATDSDVPVQALTYTLTVTNLANNSVVTNAGITNGVISWSPTEAQGPSTNRFRTVVSDGQATRTNIFDVVVTEVNVAPVFVGTPANRTISEQSQMVVTNNATDADLPANTLSYQLINPPAGALISSNGVINWSPSANQGATTYTITTVVSDGTASATNSFVVVVLEGNPAPAFVLTPTNRTIAELTLLTVTNQATDFDVPPTPLHYQLIGAPSGAVIDTNGVITWLPGEDQGPTTNTIITVVDDGTQSVSNSFVVTVTEVNVAPTFVGTPSNMTIAELVPLTVTNAATDTDLPASILSYTLINPPTNATVDASGVIRWTPSVLQGPSVSTFTTVVSDGMVNVTNAFVVSVNDTLLGATTNLTLISTGAVWRYLDNGSDPGTGWRGLGFNDAGWSNGAAQLGYGDGDEQTVVSYGTNSSAKYITTYFRRTFTLADASYFSALNIRVLRDDGVVVYLNGAEVYRDNMPAGIVNYQTLASASIGGVDETTYFNAALAAVGLVSGTNVVAVEIHQNVATSSDLSFDLELTGVRNLMAPVFLGTPTNRTIGELTLLTVTNTATDVDTPADTLTYGLVNAPGNATISTNGVITWTPGESEGPGTNVLTSVVSDGSVSVTNAFTVVVSEVNVAPAFVLTPTNRTIGELTLLTVTNAATDSDLPVNTLTYSLLNPPGNAAINTNGVITWTPGESEGPGTNVLTSVVSDGSVSVTNAFTVVVSEVNVAPVFVGTPTNRTIGELTLLTVTNKATDADLPANVLNYSLLNPPGNAAINTNGVITWTPGESEGPGTNTLTTVVSDGSVSVTNAFTVVVSEVNVAPAFVLTPTNRTIGELTLLTVTNAATDSDLPVNTLTYSLLNPPGNAAINTNGVITWTPGESEGPGTNVLTSVVSDGSVSVTNAFTVVVSEVNVAPVFVGTPTNRTIGELTLLTVTNKATDADLPANVLNYSLLNPPGNAAINTNGVITWTPGESEGPGTNTLTTVVSDGSVSVTNAFTVVVSEVNVAPAFVLTPTNRTIGELTLLTVTNAATDSDLPVNTLTYSLLNPPGNAAINTNGVITWTPGESEGPGTNVLTSVVSDGSVSVTNAFTVVVSEVNVAPVFVGTPTNRTIGELTLLTVTNKATDADLPANVLNYSLLNPPGNAAINTNGVITWTPGESEGPGTNTLTTVVSDGSVSVTNAFTVVVSEVNVAPAFVLTPTNRTIGELTLLTVTNAATDSDLPVNTLTYSLLNPPGNAAINTNGVITWTPGESEGPGTNVLTSVASDGSVSVTNAFTVVVSEVNVAPVFVGTPTNRTIGELTLLTVTNNASDSDLPANVLNYSLLNPPGNAAINTNGVITWTPGESEGPGTNTLTTVVSDGSVSVTNAFTVVVSEVNVAPAFVLTPTNRTIGELTLLTVTNAATDSDLPVNTLTYSLLNPPGNAAINTNGVITWTPGESEGPGTNVLTSVVSDGSVSMTNAFTVVVSEENVAPIFATTPTDRNVHKLSLLTVTNNASDSDLPANVLSYSLVNAPGNATISTNGVITWTPGESEGPGTNVLTTVVSDGAVSVSNSFVVTVSEVDVSPVFAETPTNRTINELTLLTVTNNATDSDLPADTLTYSLLNAPGNASISNNGVITWTPGESEGPGTNTLTTVVSDGSVSVTNAFTVVVSEVNVAPIFATTPTDRNVHKLSLLTVTNVATDSDLPANTLNYSLLDAPGNATISSNGVITWTPGESEGPGTSLLTTVVSDGAVSVTNSFVVTVSEVDVAPVFAETPTNRTINELTLLTVTNNATDSDLPADTLTYSLLNAPGNASISTNGVITWTPGESEGPGTNTLTTVVSDGSISLTNSFVVTVGEVDVAPVLLEAPNRTINELTTLTVTNSATDSDLPANVLNYSLLNAPGNATISTNGVITWTPGESEGPGTNTLTTVVSDGTISVTNSFAVTVGEVNVAPVFVSTPTNRTINELTLLMVTNNASDSDLPANTLSYSLLNAPGNATISTNGVITWTPGESEGPGTNTLTTVVSDGTLSVTNSFAVTVGEVNVAPVFVSTPTNRSINELTLLTVTNNASDSDLPANTLSYSLLNGPGNATISTNGVITWTPGESEGPGTNALTTVVSDGTLSVTNSFVVTVGEVDVAPVFAGTPTNRTINELTLLTVTNKATDADLPANVLSYSLLNAPGNATISSNGVITWTPGESEGPGTNTLTTVVSDGTLSVTNSFVVTVSEVDVAPVFVSTPTNRTINELTLLTVTNNASDSDLPANTLSYSLLNGPGNATISTNGVITWTPGESEGPGTNALTTVVSDGTISVTNSFAVTVGEVNVAPVFVSTPTNRTINELTLLMVTNNASDSDLPANTLSYSLLNAPGNATISTNGVITWTPGESEGPGTNTLTTVVSDGTLSVTNSFAVTVGEVNVAPVFVSTPTNRSINELTLLTVTNNASDSDLPANTLSYSLLNGPGNATISTNGVITWTPGESEGPGTNALTTVVSDGTLSVTNSFVVTVGEVDVAPVFAGTPTNRTINELTLLTVTNKATDADLPANVLSYSLLNAPGNATISSNGVITWTPGESEGPGTNTLTTVVSDGTLSVTNSFVVTVSEVDVAPVFVSTPTNRTINELTLLTVTNNASDSDLPANTLSYSLLNGPGNATISTNGVITWTPGESEGPGTNALTTVVSDGTISVTNSFAVTVGEVNVAPVFVSTPTNRTINELTLLMVTNNASDSDLPANTLSYSLLNAPGNATISTNGVITWTPGESEGPGTNTLTTVVSDGTLSVTNSFAVTVGEVNVAPVFVSTPTNRSINELTLLTVTNNASDSDLPANTLSYSLLNGPGNATISTNGVITWTPGESEGPGTNALTTVVSDGTLSVTNSFVVTVGEVDVAPVVVDDAYSVSNATMTVSAPGILANDTDSDLPANILTAILVVGPTNGVLNLSSNGGFTYTPNTGFNGTDSFTYRANDGLTASSVATVSLTVSTRLVMITSITVSNGLAEITWNSEIGTSYRLQYKTNLTEVGWTEVQTDVTAGGSTASMTNSVGADPSKFFRVRIVP